MELPNNSSGQDTNNRPPVDRGPGNGGQGGTRDTYSRRGSCRRGNNRDSHNDDGNRRNQFACQESAMNGHVFDYTSEWTPEKYIQMMKELLAHVGLTYKENTTELKEGLENLALVDPTELDNPPKGNQVAFKLWKMDIKEYCEKLKVFANF